VNHYYLYQYLAENPGAPVANKFLNSGAGALVNVAGVGILTSAANPTGASSFVDYLLSPTAQEYFATETSEYPVVPGTPAPEGLPPLNSIGVSGLDLNRLEDLAGTLELLQAKGVV
jgi:iron(III) transport system substrate-binding protein